MPRGSIAYTAKNGAKRFKPTWKRLERVLKSGEYTGFCLGCGASRDCCEPDARRYPCEGCGEALVFGAEELALMGIHGK